MEGYEQQELEYLIENCTPVILRVATGILHDEEDAKDVCQEVFIQLLSTPNIRNKPGWLYRVAINRAINLNKQKIKRKILERQINNREEKYEDNEHYAQDVEILEKLKQVIATLPDGQRIAFLLRHQAGMLIKDIAKTLQITEGTVKKQLSRALETIRMRINMKGLQDE